MQKQLDIPMEKKNSDPSITPYATINMKWIIDRTVRVKTTKLLEENTGGNICKPGLGKDFLECTTKE